MPGKRRQVKARGGLMLSAADKWNAMNWAGKTFVAACAALITVAGASQAWTTLGLDVHLPATRQWVMDAQYPIQQGVNTLLLGQLNARIGAIEDQMVALEIQKSKAVNAGERAKIDFEIEKRRNERAGLLQQIQSLSGAHR